jgi:Mrp family chromosome partitioning ATPase
MKMLPSPEPTSFDKLTTTWSIIEARPSLPALIAVASATKAEETEPIARGLARVAQEAGQRTGYLYLGSAKRIVREHGYAYTDLALSGRPTLRENFDRQLDSWRAHYDVIIVELPLLASCSLGAHVARLAEGVVIALTPGRKVAAADRELTALLGQLSASIIGVVKTGTVPSGATPLPARSKSLTSRFFPVRQP